MTKKQIEAYIDKRIGEMKSDIARQVRIEIDDVLTHGTVHAVNERIKGVMQQHYEITVAIALKKNT